LAEKLGVALVEALRTLPVTVPVEVTLAAWPAAGATSSAAAVTMRLRMDVRGMTWVVGST
jgi:hypothetical protein